MGLSVAMDFSDVQKFEGRTHQFLGSLMQEVSRQTLFFIGSIQRNQMTGRKGDIYLNVQSGTLRRSWFPETKFVNGEIIAKAHTEVKYASFHQSGFITPSGRAVPKRLFVLEQFEREMPDRYRNACLKAMKRLKNG